MITKLGRPLLPVAALLAVVALGGAPLAAHAAPVPSTDEELFVAAVDGSAYGPLEQVAVDAVTAELITLGEFPFDEEGAAGVRVTAVDHVAQTGDVIALVTAPMSEEYVCFLVTIDGESGEPVETPVPLSDGTGAPPLALSAPCTALDTAPVEGLGATGLPVDQSGLEAVDEVGPIAIVGAVDSTLLIVDISTGLTFQPVDIEEGPEIALEALALVPLDLGDGQSTTVLLLAYGSSLIFWLGGFEPDPQLIDLVAGRIVGLDLDAAGLAWFTWIDESGDEDVTRVGAVELVIGPSPALESASGAEVDRGVAGVELRLASAVGYGAITLDGSPVAVEAITVVPAGFGEVGAGDDDELAVTGTTSAGALALGAMAGALIVLGVLLAVRRRTA